MSEIVRKLASVRKIADIKPIDGADVICAYKIDGWWVVDAINKYTIDQKVIYFEIDSWIPTDIAPFLSKGNEPREYLGVKGERLRTIKLRGQLSQGLILPLSIINHISIFKWYEGEDLTNILGIQKWEPPVNVQLAGKSRGNFPHFIRKTDQERIQNIGKYIKNSYKDKDGFEVSIKVDGSSCTVYHYDGDVGVCSHNINLKIDQEGNAFVNIANKTNLLKVLEVYGKNIAVQGELMGPGIQKNRENFKEHQLYVFDIFDIDKQEYLSPLVRQLVYNDLTSLGYSGEHVPILNYNYILPTDDIDALLFLAEGRSINNLVREGLVYKRHDGKFSFKVVCNNYLLKDK